VTYCSSSHNSAGQLLHGVSPPKMKFVIVVMRTGSYERQMLQDEEFHQIHNSLKTHLRWCLWWRCWHTLCFIISFRKQGQGTEQKRQI